MLYYIEYADIVGYGGMAKSSIRNSDRWPPIWFTGMQVPIMIFALCKWGGEAHGL